MIQFLLQYVITKCSVRQETASHQVYNQVSNFDLIATVHIPNLTYVIISLSIMESILTQILSFVTYIQITIPIKPEINNCNVLYNAFYLQHIECKHAQL